MIDEPAVGTSFKSASPQAVMLEMLPPGMLLWAGIYTAMFYVCGGMIAALYSND